jgi:hypothetical protein
MKKFFSKLLKGEFGLAGTFWLHLIFLPFVILILSYGSISVLSLAFYVYFPPFNYIYTRWHPDGLFYENFSNDWGYFDEPRFFDYLTPFVLSFPAMAWVLLAAIGTWRAAKNYGGPKIWKIGAWLAGAFTICMWLSRTGWWFFYAISSWVNLEWLSFLYDAPLSYENRRVWELMDSMIFYDLVQESFIGLIVVLSLAWGFSMLKMLIDCIKYQPPESKTVWVLVQIFLPILGTILYFFVGRKTEDRSQKRVSKSKPTLGKCRQCNKSVSPNALSCPNCGEPNPVDAVVA